MAQDQLLCSLGLASSAFTPSTSHEAAEAWVTHAVCTVVR